MYDDKIAYESTLGDALKQLFGDGGDVDGSASGKTGKGKEAAGSASNGKSKKDYIEKAQKAYKDAQKAVKNSTMDLFFYLNCLQEFEFVERAYKIEQA